MQLVHRADRRDIRVPHFPGQLPGRSVNKIDRMQRYAVEIVADVTPDDDQVLGDVSGVPLGLEGREVTVEVVTVDNLPVGF